ncbi:uncharacterized protein N7511_008252 [Penicillium nucicola]|uniref:uncharacterized protein n=1 Tax=Penicillium nucicola TaxID=1850975 RepID=UPI002544D947|nr:uncharacterized protein N7511_008252 [Penicillium nucicola]KAJ5754099.1 hypothetical protein N7511_008252 [Penicillium nucicola]
MWPGKISTTYDRLRGVDSHSGSETQQPFSDREALKQEVENELSSAPRPHRLQQLREVILILAAAICLWIVLVTAWRTTVHPASVTVRYEKKTLHCGNSTAEAEAAGCAFDLLSHNWMAPQCLDPLTEAEYRAYVTSPERMMGPYPYFLDAEGTRRVGDERAFALLADGHPVLADQHVYTTREEHLAHCKFLMRRMHRAVEGKVRLNDENLGFWHTAHCLEEISHPDRKPLGELNEGFYVGYAPCTIEVPV